MYELSSDDDTIVSKLNFKNATATMILSSLPERREKPTIIITLYEPPIVCEDYKSSFAPYEIKAGTYSYSFRIWGGGLESGNITYCKDKQELENRLQSEVSYYMKRWDVVDIEYINRVDE